MQFKARKNMLARKSRCCQNPIFFNLETSAERFHGKVPNAITRENLALILSSNQDMLIKKSWMQLAVESKVQKSKVHLKSDDFEHNFLGLCACTWHQIAYSGCGGYFM